MDGDEQVVGIGRHAVDAASFEPGAQSAQPRLRCAEQTPELSRSQVVAVLGRPRVTDSRDERTESSGVRRAKRYLHRHRCRLGEHTGPRGSGRNRDTAGPQTHDRPRRVGYNGGCGHMGARRRVRTEGEDRNEGRGEEPEAHFLLARRSSPAGAGELGSRARPSPVSRARRVAREASAPWSLGT